MLFVSSIQVNGNNAHDHWFGKKWFALDSDKITRLIKYQHKICRVLLISAKVICTWSITTVGLLFGVNSTLIGVRGRFIWHTILLWYSVKTRRWIMANYERSKDFCLSLSEIEFDINDARGRFMWDTALITIYAVVTTNYKYLWLRRV